MNRLEQNGNKTGGDEERKKGRKWVWNRDIKNKKQK